MIRRYWHRFQRSRAERRLLREFREVHTDLQNAIARLDSNSQTVLILTQIEIETRIREIREWTRYLSHSRLVGAAERLLIPIPPRTITDSTRAEEDESWDFLKSTNTWVLKPNNVRTLMAAIREERKARRDYILGWITPFVSIIGVILGAVLGYILGSRK